jgi:hypothetical protein
MGLDITAYSGLRLSSAKNYEEASKLDGAPHHLYPTPDFLPQADALVDGYYFYEECSEFHAGSYYSYNVWRDLLARFANYPPIKSASPLGMPTGYPYASYGWDHPEEKLPFIELINFSDCEGVIGPITSKKLAADFNSFDPQLFVADESYFLIQAFIRKYIDFKDAFLLASNNGAVLFH